MMLMIALIFLQGCTNSKMIIGPLYNQLDNQMRKEFNKLADFNEAQTAAFEQTLGTFHVWHRQAELPQYAALMQEVANSIKTPGTTAEQIRSWSEAVEGHSRTARECHPVNFSFDLMKTLTDDQLDFIERRFARQQAKNKARYESRSAEDRVIFRLNRLQKWAGRIDLEFNASQRAMIRSALTRQVSLRSEYYRLSADWNKQLFTLARDQQNPAYDSLMSTHLDRLWSLLESAYPEQWRQNREMWQEVAHRFVSSMTTEQRRNSSRWIAKMGRTLSAISKDKPSFTPGSDPSIGCLVPVQSGS